jgi:hypothetical protein
MSETFCVFLLTTYQFKNEQEKANFKPRLHMFYNERVMDIPDGLPKWTGINEGENSELVEDSPPEDIKTLERKRSREAKERTAQNSK